ncbi:MAG TPA: aspartate kinase [Chitinophagaceae bacterium]
MKVFKFGGASVNSIDRIRQVGNILALYQDQQLVVVISAMGKTTNALEQVAETFFSGNTAKAQEVFGNIRQQHLQIARDLLTVSLPACEQQLAAFFTEAEWLIYELPTRAYDYYYDQLVCIGELLSTTIVSFYLGEAGINNTWFDVRDIIRTDDNFRDANIDWPFTEQRVQELVRPLFLESNVLLTQGFIGATDENESTTLGREGSDYTGAVFANMLDAEAQLIWKDVENVMNADPKKFPDAQPIPELNYTEVIEMAYYGAQVIHPKTIKPLQNKNIPLFVKCFLDPALPGTMIHNRPIHDLPPIIVVKEKQVLVELRTRDFSFVGETHVAALYSLFDSLKIKPNLTQNAAISFIAVLDDKAERLQQLGFDAAELFEVTMLRELTLLTIRHYTGEVMDQLTGEKKVLLRQQTPDTVQLLLA